MGARALAMELDDAKTDYYSPETENLVNLLMSLRSKNEEKKSPNGKLRAWINERLTVLAMLPHLRPETAEKVLEETRNKLTSFFNNPLNELHSRKNESNFVN